MITVEVCDTTEVLSLTLEDVPETTTAAQLCERLLDEWRLPHEVQWRLRDSHTGTPLMPDQQLAECVEGSAKRLDLTLVPLVRVC